METFAEVRKHVIDNHRLFMDEPFQLGFDSRWMTATGNRVFSLPN